VRKEIKKRGAGENQNVGDIVAPVTTRAGKKLGTGEQKHSTQKGGKGLVLGTAPAKRVKRGGKWVRGTKTKKLLKGLKTNAPILSKKTPMNPGRGFFHKEGGKNDDEKTSTSLRPGGRGELYGEGDPPKPWRTGEGGERRSEKNGVWGGAPLKPEETNSLLIREEKKSKKKRRAWEK